MSGKRTPKRSSLGPTSGFAPCRLMWSRITTSAINSTITSQPSSSPPPPPRSRLGHQCEPDDAGDGWEARPAASPASQELLAPPPPELPPPNPEKQIGRAAG